MGHKQPPTPIQTDNTTAFGFVSKIMVPKATKSTDMKYWWMRDRSDQKISDITGEKEQVIELIIGLNIFVQRIIGKRAPKFSRGQLMWPVCDREKVSVLISFELTQGCARYQVSEELALPLMGQRD